MTNVTDFPSRGFKTVLEDWAKTITSSDLVFNGCRGNSLDISILEGEE